MNYIELINKFWTINLEATFSHAEVHLYFKLLEINNRLGWKNEFKLPNTRLEGETGMRSKTLINARQRLIDFGLITYKKGSTRKAGTYSFFSLQPTKESNKETNKESKKDSNIGSNTEVIKGTLNKLNKTKQEKKEVEKETFPNPSTPTAEIQKKVFYGIERNTKEAYELAKKEGIWLESICMNYHLDMKDVTRETKGNEGYLLKFKNWLLSGGKADKSLSDFKSHFNNWLSKRLIAEKTGKTGYKHPASDFSNKKEYEKF